MIRNMRVVRRLAACAMLSCSGARATQPVAGEPVADRVEHPICGTRPPDICFADERKPFTAYNDWNRLAPVYEYACLSDVPEACAEYGEFWFTYDRKTRDSEALRKLKVACDAGSAKACLYAGFVGGQHDSLLARGCELGNGMACGKSGELMQLRDKGKARGFFERGCELEDGKSCSSLAEYTDDPTEKATLRERACEYEALLCGHGSDFVLDECRTRGLGCSGLLFLAGVPEAEQAVIGTLEGACQRQASMCAILGEVHVSPRVSSANRDKAIAYFRRACDSDERYVLPLVNNSCARWVKLTCVEDAVCTDETLEMIGKLASYYQLSYEIAWHCRTGDTERARELIEECDCNLECENGTLHKLDDD